MAKQRSLPAVPPTADREHPSAPSDRIILAGVGGTALWVIAWLTVQLHGSLGWVLPLVPGAR
jgi:hypothetical protein